MREYPCPSFPRCSASSKCSHSVVASPGSHASAPSRLRPSSRCTASELEHRPAALPGDAAQLAVGIDRDRMPDRLEERKIRVAVGGGGARRGGVVWSPK